MSNPTMNRYSYGDSAAMLRANGYAPAPLDADGHPFGPWRQAQIDYSRYDYAQAPACVLTAVALPRSERDPIRQPATTRLVCITLRVRQELLAKAARILKGKCLARVTDDAIVHVFALDNDSVPFGAMNVHVDGVGSVNIDSHASYIELGEPKEWRGGRDPLNTPRSELPPLDQHEAVQSVFNPLHELLHAHAPAPAAAPAPFVLKPILEPGQRFLFDNVRAVNTLRRNGYNPRPVAWGDTDEQGVAVASTATPYGRLFHGPMSSTPGRSETWLATVELKTKRADIAAALDAIFVRHTAGASCPVRISSDGSTLRVFRWPQGVFAPVEFMRSAGTVGQFVRDGGVRLRIAVPETIVISSLDDAGKPYTWRDGDLLTIKRDELPELDSNKAAWIARDIEKLLESGRFSDEPQRTQEAATAA